MNLFRQIRYVRKKEIARLFTIFHIKAGKNGLSRDVSLLHIVVAFLPDFVL